MQAMDQQLNNTSGKIWVDGHWLLDPLLGAAFVIIAGVFEMLQKARKSTAPTTLHSLLE